MTMEAGPMGFEAVDDADVAAYRRAKSEYEANPVSYSSEEVMAEFGLVDDADVAAYRRAKAEYEANPVSYSLDEVEEMLGLTEGRP